MPLEIEQHRMMPAPPAPTEPSKLSTAEALKLTGNAAAGQARIAVCYTCHVIGKQGLDFGPDLTYFGKTQPKDVVIEAIINPSKDIAHGYDAKTVVTEAVADRILATLGEKYFDRYAVVAWVLIQVADSVVPALLLPAWTTSLIVVLLLICFPIALMLAWATRTTLRRLSS